MTVEIKNTIHTDTKFCTSKVFIRWHFQLLSFDSFFFTCLFEEIHWQTLWLIMNPVLSITTVSPKRCTIIYFNQKCITYQSKVGSIYEIIIFLLYIQASKLTSFSRVDQMFNASFSKLFKANIRTPDTAL